MLITFLAENVPSRRNSDVVREKAASVTLGRTCNTIAENDKVFIFAKTGVLATTDRSSEGKRSDVSQVHCEAAMMMFLSMASRLLGYPRHLEDSFDSMKDSSRRSCFTFLAEHS